MRTVLTVLMLGGLVVPAAAQEQSSGGVMRGQVVDGATGRPIGAATVSISGSGMTVNPLPNAPLPILTNADGRFVFTGLAPGSYAVRSTKGGYAEGASGRRRPGGGMDGVTLDPSTLSADVVIRMWKYGAISGTLTDEAGEPLVGATVRLIQKIKAGSDPQSSLSGNGAFVRIPRPYVSAAAPAETDDRGVYRFANLGAGDYLVLASPPPVSQTRTAPNNGPPGARRLGLPFASGGGNPVTIARAVDLVTPLVVNDAYVAVGGATLLPPPAGGRSRIYPATFYPSATSALQASIVALAAGEERTSVDIQLAPVPVVRVSGTVLTASGPEAMAQLHLVPTGTEGFPQEAVAPATVSDAEGNFVFAAVTPGQYTLRGGLPRTDGTVSMPIMVGSDDIDGVAVTARPALSITAAVQFDGNARPPSADDRRGPLAMPAFLLDPADQTVTVDQLGIEIAPVKGSYLLTGFSPGRYRVRVPNSPSGWMFKAALLNGVDVSEIPFDFTRDVTDLTLVFTDRWTSVGGTVQGAAADGAAVVAFPADASQWTGDAMSPRRFKTARVNARREFGMSALPPGDYYMAAVPEDQTDGWRDPSVLDALARVATRVTIVEGEHTTVGLPFQRIQQ